MKKTTGFLFSALLLTSLSLAACGGKKESKASSDESEKIYNYVFLTDPTSFDYTVSGKSSDGDLFYNFVEGLMDFDQYGNLVPAMAEDWEVSKDGLTYTYHLKKDVPWVNSEGNEVDTVKAQDFVTGLKHAVEAKSQTLYIVQDSIKGLNDYVSGKEKDFSKVGIKAVDDNTLQYTLNQPESYWNSKLTYGSLFPVNEDFLKEKGTKFGSTSPDSILYNGPFTLSNFTSKSVIEYSKNPAYWDEKSVKLDGVKLTFSAGSDPDEYYRGFDEGKFSQARVYPNNPAFKEIEKKYQDNIIWSLPNRSTYNLTFNFSRGLYKATNKHTLKDKEDTQKAIWNKDFRKAIQFAVNKTSYLAQSVGQTGAEKAIRNTYVPGDFVSIDNKPFYSFTQQYLREMDPEAFGKVNLVDGQEGYYDVTKAKEFMAKAKEALTKDNVTFPIHLDLPQNETNEVSVNNVKSIKKSIEDAVGTDNVVVDIQLMSSDAYDTITYLATSGAETDFDIANASGWSADFSDPISFLNVFHSQKGDQLQTIGLDVEGTYKNGVDRSKAAKDAIHLQEYDALVEKADAIKDNPNERYKAFAKAEAWLLDNVIQIPLKAGGGIPSLTKSNPFTTYYGTSGATDVRFKGVELLDHPMTVKEYNDNLAKWEKEKEVSNTKAEKEIQKKFDEAK